MRATVVTASTILVLTEEKRVKTASSFHYCDVEIEKDKQIKENASFESRYAHSNL